MPLAIEQPCDESVWTEVEVLTDDEEEILDKCCEGEAQPYTVVCGNTDETHHWQEEAYWLSFRNAIYSYAANVEQSSSVPGRESVSSADSWSEVDDLMLPVREVTCKKCTTDSHRSPTCVTSVGSISETSYDAVGMESISPAATWYKPSQEPLVKDLVDTTHRVFLAEQAREEIEQGLLPKLVQLKVQQEKELFRRLSLDAVAVARKWGLDKDEAVVEKWGIRN